MRSSGAPVSSAAGCARRFAPRRPLNAIVRRKHNTAQEDPLTPSLSLDGAREDLGERSKKLMRSTVDV